MQPTRQPTLQPTTTVGRRFTILLTRAVLAVALAAVVVAALPAEETAFFGLFASPVPGFEETALEVIAAGLRRGACERDVKRSARLLQAYELDFWQTVGEVEP